ncbi:MAG: hypothetical protein QM703_03885 [Gemmatales bacterium]
MQQALAPYIVTLWNGREPEDAPDEVKQLLKERGRSRDQSNILVFVLDTQGKYVHSFDAMTDRHPAPIHEIKKRMPSYFVQELNKAGKELGIPVSTSATARTIIPCLPTARDPGVRIYVTLGENRLNHFMVPIVEAVRIDEKEQQSLRYSKETHKIDASVLQRWLAQMYPAAVMDGHGGMNQVTGTLTYTPAGENETHRYAVLRGNVRFELDNQTKITYQGPFDLVLRYTKTSDELDSVWGTMTTKIPRADMKGKTVELVSMSVAIESIPKTK